MKIRKIIAALTAAVLCVGLTACGGGEEEASQPEEKEEIVVDEEAAGEVAGTYEFEEEVSFNGDHFTTPWTLELKEDGTYQMTTEDMMGKKTYTGVFSVTDGVVTTGTPEEEEIQILSEWFNNDYSCDWVVDKENGTCTPVNYGDGMEVTGGADNAASFADTYEGESYLDVSYASVSESDVMDIFLPESDQDVPVVVMIHGGAFMFGDKEMEQVSRCFQPLLDGGYAVATINYRLADEAVYPGAVADAKAAVRFLKANAREYGIDGENIFVWGESAGAYLANMVAETSHVEELNGDVDNNLEYDSSVKGLVSFFAPVDWYNMDADFEELGVAEGERPMGPTATDQSGESTFLGQNIAEDEAVTVATNPVSYIEEMSQPEFYAFIEHGDADTNVPYVQSERLYEALSGKYGKENITLKILEGAAHEDDAFYTEENLKEIISFLNAVPR